MTKTNHYSELPKDTKQKKVKKYIVTAGQYLILFSGMILLAGHENTRTHAKNGFIDLYVKESQELIKVQTDSFLQLSEADSTVEVPFVVNYLVSNFYKERDYLPVWTINFSTTAVFNELINILDSAAFYGFPEDYFNLYGLKEVQTKMQEKTGDNWDITKRIKLEIEASRSFILFILYLKNGFISEVNMNEKSDFIRFFPQFLNSSFENKSLRYALTNIESKLTVYENLKNAVPEFLEVKQNLKYLGDSIIGDTLLSKALFYAGTIEQFFFDSTLTRENSVKLFQKEHKLTSNGAVNYKTLIELNKALQYKFYQLCLNFDRVRKIDIEHYDYLLVNIPEFKLHIIENLKIKEQYNVIVGSRKTPTPTLSSQIERMVANPYWTVPKSITRNEMLGKIRRDSSFLVRNGYFIIDKHENSVDLNTIDWSTNDPLGGNYWIRQTNSRGNALGQVKFLFPNKHSVYMHDTPGKRLFKKKYRAYSHGCIRLQNPEQLADYLSAKLFEPENRPKDIKAEIKSRKRRVFHFDCTVPIHIQYITSMGDTNKVLRFYADIYKKDQKEINELFPVEVAM